MLACVRAWTRRCEGGRRTWTRIRSAPASARAMATAWPMPRVPPVTTAVWPSRENRLGVAMLVNWSCSRLLRISQGRIITVRGSQLAVCLGGWSQLLHQFPLPSSAFRPAHRPLHKPPTRPVGHFPHFPSVRSFPVSHRSREQEGRFSTGACGPGDRDIRPRPSPPPPDSKRLPGSWLAWTLPMSHIKMLDPWILLATHHHPSPPCTTRPESPHHLPSCKHPPPTPQPSWPPQSKPPSSTAPATSASFVPHLPPPIPTTPL